VTSAQNGSPTRALVLGGGGAVGIAWQTGLLSGLRDAGVDFASADTVVGTSAGALVGALLSGGREVTDALASLAALKEIIDLDSLAAGDQAFLEIMTCSMHCERSVEPRTRRTRSTKRST
jgi:NTE family protein